MFRGIRNKLSDYRFEKRMAKQRYKKGFSDQDCWSMSYWLTETFPKMILNLRDMKHSAPDLKYEEYDKLPKEWKEECKKLYREKEAKYDYKEEEDSIFEKWFVLLSRIAYCLQEASEDKEIYNKYEKEYFTAVFGEDFYKEDDKKFNFKEWWNKRFEKVEGGYLLKQNKVDEELQKKFYKEEEKNWKYKEKMKDEALDLIKKYFYNLWD